MTDLRTQIRDALRDEEGERLSIDDAAIIRRVVVASVRPGDHRRRAMALFQPLAVAATLVAMIAVGLVMGQRFDDSTAAPATSAGSEDASPAWEPHGARQLHFSTPGGTRIIWIFNSELDLKTTP